MGVDEPRGRDAPPPVHDAGPGRGRRRTGSDRDDPAVLDDDVSPSVLGADGIPW